MVVIATSILDTEMDTPKTADLDKTIRAALRGAIRRSAKSRQQIVEELGRVHGLSVSVPTLNNWTGDSKRDRRVPAEAIPALCAVLGDDSLQRLLLSPEQIGRLDIGDRVAKWLDKTYGPARRQDDAGKLQRKSGRSAARTANHP